MEKVPLLFLTFISYFPEHLKYQAHHTSLVHRIQRVDFVFSILCPVYRVPGLDPSVNIPVTSGCPGRTGSGGGSCWCPGTAAAPLITSS